MWLLIIYDPSESYNITENTIIFSFKTFENALSTFQTLINNMLRTNEISTISANRVYNEMLKKHHAYYTDLQYEIREI